MVMLINHMVDNVRHIIYNFDRIYKTSEYILKFLIVGGY